MSSAPPPHPQRPIVEALETKLLYSADFAPAAFLAADVSATHQVQSPQTELARSELVFMDASVPDLQILLDDLHEQASQGRSIEVIVIESDDDGLSRITEELSRRQDVTAVHLLGHGDAGHMQLGTSTLDADTLLQRAPDIAAWGSSLTDQADILLYGCDVAASDAGKALTRDLAQLTGADVAASDDPTGHLSLGGDWQLEISTGTIEARTTLSTAAMAEWTGLLAEPTPSGKGTGVWTDTGLTAPQQAAWDGLTLGTSGSTALASTWQVITSASSPTRDEAIVIGVNASGGISGQIWNGSQWTALPLPFPGSGTNAARQGFAVAYEQSSGDAMVVWNTGSALQYSVFNGSTWTGAQALSAFTGVQPERLQIAAQPGGDGMVLSVSTAVVSATVTDYALIWNGSSWGNLTELDNSGKKADDQLTTAVAYESLSGRAMVAFTKYSTEDWPPKDYNVYYSLFDGSAWTLPTAAGAYGSSYAPYTLTLASDPHSNRIAFGLVGAQLVNINLYEIDSSLSVWNGASWGARQTDTSTVVGQSSMGPSVAVGFESNSGDVLAVYRSGNNAVRYATWSPITSTWNVSGGTITLSDAARTVRLFSDPTSDHLIAGINTAAGTLSFHDWRGNAWVSSTTATTQTGTAGTAAFTWFWQNPRLNTTPNDLWLGSNQDTSGWTGVNTVSDTEVLSLEGSNPQYGTSTSGSFSHQFDLGAFGASGLDDIAWVTREVQLNNWLTLQRGDVLFTVTNAGTLSSTNSKSVSHNDVVLFRPDSPGDYSHGTFSILIQGLGDGSDIQGLALVEQSVQMGDVTLQTGEILFSMGSGSTGSDIYRFVPSVLDLGTGLLSGLYSPLIIGSEIGINQVIKGLEVITTVTTLSNITLPAGSLLLSFEQAGVVGTVPIAVGATDVVLVTPTFTSAGGSAAQATAEVIFTGSSVGITSGHIDTLTLSRQTPPSIIQPGAGATSTLTVNENQTAVTTVQATDPDANTTLSYRIAGGADAALFMMNGSTGQLTFANAPDREQPGDVGGDNVYEVIVAASDGDLEDFQALAVTVNDVNESPVITSNGGGATASLQVAELQTLATSVQAVDPEGAAISYTITGGADAALFSIHATTGQLTFLQAPNATTPQDSGANNVYQVTVSASVGADTDTQQLQITVLALNRPPVNALPGSLSLFEDSSMTISGIQVSDIDAGSASIQVSFSVQHGTLEIASTVPGGLTSANLAYSPDERQVTLTGTLAQINTTLASSQALTYRTDSDYAGGDALVMVSDDLGNSGVASTPAQTTDTDSTSLSIQAVNDAPVISLGNTTLTYLENDPAQLIYTDLILGDIDSSTLTQATIRIDSGYVNGQDLLSFTPTSGLTSAWDASTGTLTLSGTASLSTYQTALRSVSYFNNSESPSTSSRTISVSVSDGASVNPSSASVSRGIDLTSVRDAPALQTSTTSLSYMENSGGLIVDSGLQLSDADSATLQSATVRITDGYVVGRDQLVFVDQNGITGNWTASTGTLTLTGSASLADYQSALRSVFYRHTSDNPGSADRVVTFTVNDGDQDSLTRTRTIGVVATDDAPSLSTSSDALIHEENAAPSPVDPNLSLSDPDNTQLSSATIRISSGYVQGEDVLIYTAATGITGTWDADQGLLSLSGLATVEDYQLALRSVTYQNLSEAPSDQPRALAFQVSDGELLSSVGTRALTVLPHNDAPVITSGISPLSYTENGAPLLITGTALTLSDVDSPTLNGAVLTLGSGYAQGQDVLSFVDQSGITGLWSEATGTLTLSGQASLVDYQTALRSITYVNSSDHPSETPREITLTVRDATTDSAPVTWSLNLLAVNDAPVLHTDGSAPTYIENATPTLVATGLTISDLDHALLSQATVHLVGHVPGQDVLSFSGQAGITALWDADLGTLTLTGDATLADYETALARVSYTNLSDDPDTRPRTIEITVSDASLAPSPVISRALTITAQNDAPVLSTAGPGITYQENAPATVLNPGLLLSDVDNSTLTGASVWISAGHVPGQDLLSVAPPAGISSLWDADAGILTLSGSASVADYQSALRSIRYTHLSDAPIAGERTVSFQAHDNNAPSAVATQTILVSAINDAPALLPSVASATHQENAAWTSLDTGLTLSDADHDTLVGATLQITGNHAPDQDRLGFLNESFLNQAGIESSWDATSGTLVLTGTASVSDYQTALRSVVYQNDSDDPSTASRTVTLVLNDGATDNALSEAALYTINVVASNDAPTIVTSTDALNYAENSAPVIVDTQISLADLDHDMLSGATVRFGQGYTLGQDLLAFQDADGIAGTWDADNGILSLTGVASVADYQSALRRITYLNTSDNPDTGTRILLWSVSDGHTDNGVSATATRTLSITPINDAPVVTSAGTVSLTYTENSAAVPLGDVVILSDADNLTLQGATVRISSHYIQGQDLLALPQHAGITSTWNAETGTLTLQGAASLADYQAALRSISYTNTSDAPDVSTRTVSIEVHDGDTGSAPMVSPAAAWSIVAVNDAPVVSLNSLTIQQGDQATPELLVTDAEQSAEQLLVTADAVFGGRFVDLTSGQAVDRFTVQALQSGAIVFEQDGSGTVPSYQLTISDGVQSTLAPAPDIAMIRTIQIGAPVTTPEATPDSNTVQEEAASSETPSDEATSAAADLVTDTQTVITPDDTTPQRESLELRRAALAPPPPLEFSMSAPLVRISIDAPTRVSWTAGSNDAQMNDFSYRWTGSLQSGAAAQELNRSLNALREQFNEAGTGRQQVMVSSIAITTGLSMGYVIWLLRGGALLGSMLSSMPLWGMIDPLPILNRASGKHVLADGSDADAPLEQIFDGDHPTPPPAPEDSAHRAREGQA